MAVPIVMAMFTFGTKPAVAIASFAIFFSTAISILINCKKMHPDKPNVVVIDYILVTIMMPLVLAGSQLGGLILVLFPLLVVQILVAITLVLLAIKSFMQALKITKKENETIRKNAEAKAAAEAKGEKYKEPKVAPPPK